MPNIWNDDDYVAFDVESTGVKPEYALQPWRIPRGEVWLTSAAWVWRENNEMRTNGAIYPDQLKLRDFLHWVIREGRIIVGWNLVFDIACLIALGFRDEVFKIKWLDGMLVWRHASIEPEYTEKGRNKKSYSLKIAVPEFLPQHAGYEVDVNYHTDDPEELEKLHGYNIQDNVFALWITRKLYLQLKSKQTQAMWVEQRCLPVIADANLRGMLIDTIYSRNLSCTLLHTSNARLATLAPDGMTEEIVRSPKQLRELMYDKWKLPILFKTVRRDKVTQKKIEGDASTNKVALFELAQMDPRAKLIKEYREALGNKTKFADRMQQAAAYNEDGYARPQMRVFGTYTSRVTVSSKQNALFHFTTPKGVVKTKKIELPIGWAAHQTKRGELFRRQIIAPPGHTIVEFDADSQEFKWMAIACKDPVMLGLCMPGEDPHSYMTAQIVAGDYRHIQKASKIEGSLEEAQRKGGKVANLSLQYRTSAPKLMQTARVDYDIPMTQPESEHVWRVYQNTYKMIPNYWRDQIIMVRAKGYAETFAGRRVSVKGDWSGPWGWSMQSTAINYPIQGTGGEQKYLALSLLRDKLIEWGGYFMLDLHDGLYSILPDSQAEGFINDVGPLLNDLPYGAYWGFIPPVPMTWSCKWGKSWGALRGYKFN